MEKVEQDDTHDIFQECDNTPLTKEECEESLSDLNLQNIKLTAICGSTIEKKHKTFDNFSILQKFNNNHHVVHVGVIIVLVTIYLGITSVQKCLVGCVENTSITEQVQQHKKEMLNYLQQPEKNEKLQILEKFLEYKDICKDLEIFTKDMEEVQKAESNEKNSDFNTNKVLKDIEVDKGDGNEKDNSIEVEESSGSSGNGDCTHNKHKKSKYSIKTTNNKNGFNKYNKSAKIKYQKQQKKELNLNKKNSTAEPIIYLFALVFIYLLLKAASDINQHYKSQNKNDKRLRRCSLQSYAQTHRPDRRASKELALKQKQQQLQHRLKSLSRSSSQDQQNYPYNSQQHQLEQQHLLNSSPQVYSEQKQQQQQTITSSPVRSNVSHSSNWQLLRQHTTTHSLDNSDILNCTRGNAEISPSSVMARRCSVPAGLSYQRPKISTASPLSIVNDYASASLSRRTSITTSPIPQFPMDPNDSLVPETKRRVRMINRH